MIIFWILCVLIACTAVGAIVLTGRAAGAQLPAEKNANLAIYRDQLRELDEDVKSGTLAPAEAEAQRTEIGRRLLEASRQTAPPDGATTWPKWLVLVLPLFGLALYSQVGHPGLPDLPRQQRLAASDKNGDWEALVARVEDHLDKNPRDAEGWQLLVPNYLNMGRFADAATALQHLIDLKGPTAERFADLGEALVYDNKGLLTSQSLIYFSEALKLEGNNPKALYYQALGQAQQGKKEEAKKGFEALLANAPPDAPWRKAVEGQLAALAPDATAPALTDEQMQGAANMTGNDRMAMVHTMVDGLEQKLQDNPKDVEGWLRLIRARVVLQELDKAQASLAAARAAMATDAVAKKAIDDLANELKLK